MGLFEFKERVGSFRGSGTGSLDSSATQSGNVCATDAQGDRRPPSSFNFRLCRIEFSFRSRSKGDPVANRSAFQSLAIYTKKKGKRMLMGQRTCQMGVSITRPSGRLRLKEKARR